MKTVRGIIVLLALFAVFVTIAHIPYTVKSRHWSRPHLDAYSIAWEPLWNPPRSEAPPSIRFDILVIEWTLVAGLVALIFRATR